MSEPRYPADLIAFLKDLERRLTTLERAPRVPQITTAGTLGMQSATTGGGYTTSGAYADLTAGPVGPTVNVTLGPSGRMLVLLAGRILKTDSLRQLYMAFAVSGASSYAANDVRALTLTLSITGAYTVESTLSAAYVVSGLNAGDHTIQAKYRSGLGGSQSANVYDPVLSVLPF